MVIGSIARTAPLAQQDGFTYLGLLLAAAVIGLTQAWLTDAWRSAAWREKEQELQIASGQMRLALNQYYPSSLFHPLFFEVLPLDARAPGRQRYLRGIHGDPDSATTAPGVIGGAGGEVHGVPAARQRKQGDFGKGRRRFAAAQKSSDRALVATPAE